MNNVLYESLHKYYDTNDNMNKFNDSINGDNKISLRIIDWFVTNYSKKNNTSYEIYKCPSGKLSFESEGNQFIRNMNIYHAYKSQLKSYSKKKFDPFCRRDRIKFDCSDITVETTLGQLNFFKWALDNLITDYILLHYKDIEEDMNICYNNIHKKKETNIRKKRQEISKSATRGLNSNNIKVVIDFN